MQGTNIQAENGSVFQKLSWDIAESSKFQRVLKLRII